MPVKAVFETCTNVDSRRSVVQEVHEARDMGIASRGGANILSRAQGYYDRLRKRDRPDHHAALGVPQWAEQGEVTRHYK